MIAAFLSKRITGFLVFDFFKSAAPVPKKIPGEIEKRLKFCPKMFLFWLTSVRLRKKKIAKAP